MEGLTGHAPPALSETSLDGSPMDATASDAYAEHTVRADFERTPQLRASDADREAAADRLRIAAGEGRLEADELDERLSGVYGARWCSELVGLTSDITPPEATAVRPVFVQRRAARVNLFAVGSLLSGFFWFFWLGSLAAIPLGMVALKQIRESGGTQMGRSLALIGIALGFVGVLMLVAFLGLANLRADWD